MRLCKQTQYTKIKVLRKRQYTSVAVWVRGSFFGMGSHLACFTQWQLLARFCM